MDCTEIYLKSIGCVEEEVWYTTMGAYYWFQSFDCLAVWLVLCAILGLRLWCQKCQE